MPRISGGGWLTVVYGPSVEAGKQAFLDEIRERELHSLLSGPCVICGDFNMIYKAEDKNNSRLNLRVMCRFRHLLDDTALTELHLQGKFTWRKERLHPTLECIDHAFASIEWLEYFSTHHLRCLSSDCSDHAPLLLSLSTVQ